MKLKLNDGGRKEAGYKGSADDCVCRSISIATQIPYKEVYDALNLLAKKERPRKNTERSSSRNGVWRKTYDKYMESLGWKWTATMGIGTGCHIHLKQSELPQGRLFVRVSKHVTAVVDGVLNDTWDCSRNGTRCVYGYWSE